MTTMCPRGWTVRFRYLLSSPGSERRDTKLVYERHVFYCGQCRGYMHELAEAAKNAVHPEVE